MKCQHGNTVTVVVRPVSPVCWDDGIEFTNRHGKYVHPTKWARDRASKGLPSDMQTYYRLFRYLPIEGCPKCKAIKA